MEKKILAKVLIKKGNGGYYYDVKYKGDYREEELIKAVDSENSPFGGRVEKLYSSEEGIKRSLVVCYYD